MYGFVSFNYLKFLKYQEIMMTANTSSSWDLDLRLRTFASLPSTQTYKHAKGDSDHQMSLFVIQASNLV